MKRERLPLPRRLLHVALVAAGWLIFAWLWWRVFRHQTLGRELIIIVVAIGAFIPIVTSLWVLHNLNIHRRKGPRRSVMHVDKIYERDWAGREVAADWQALSLAPSIVVTVEEGVKRYRAEEA